MRILQLAVVTAMLQVSAFSQTATPTPTPPPSKVVKPGGKGSFLMGGWVPQFQNYTVLVPAEGYWTNATNFTAPVLPKKYVGAATGRAPVSNHWWTPLLLGPLSTQTQLQYTNSENKLVDIPGQSDFCQYLQSDPLVFLPRPDGLAFSHRDAFYIARDGASNIQAVAADYIRPAQTPNINAVAQVIVSSTAVPNRRTQGTNWITGPHFTNCSVSDFSDWWVETTFQATNGHQMIAKFGSGSPMWHATFTKGDNAEVAVNNLGVTKAVITNDALVLNVVYGVGSQEFQGGTIPTNNTVTQVYAFYGEPGSTWKIQTNNPDNTTQAWINYFTNAVPNRMTHLASAVLPDDAKQTVSLYREYAMSPVVNSTVTPTLNKLKGTVTVDYKITAPILKEVGTNSGYKEGTILTLMPHQYVEDTGDGYEFKITSGDYIFSSTNPTVAAVLYGLNGPEVLMEGSSFQQQFVVPQVLHALKASTNEDWFSPTNADRLTLIRYLANSSIQQNDQGYATSNNIASNVIANYDAGKRMTKWANAAAIANNAKMPDRYTALIANAKRLLTGETTNAAVIDTNNNWFTATNSNGSVKNNNGAVFWYDTNWQSMISYPAAYGSADLLNDHHFIHGYYIRTAAELGKASAAFITNWGPMVNLLVRDIITTTRNTPKDARGLQFPFLRTFDPWVGHSLAAGVSADVDGPNQESTSEACNAWEGVVLWARVTKNTSLETWASYLLASELRTARCYWFDVTGKFWRKTYPSCDELVNFGINYAGKLTPVNFFNPNISTVVGIQRLPMNASSIYHGTFPESAGQDMNNWLYLQGMTNSSGVPDFSQATNWSQPNSTNNPMDRSGSYPFWCDVFWSYFAITSDTNQVAWANKLVSPSTPTAHDSILEQWPIVGYGGTSTDQTNAYTAQRIYNQFDQGDSKANVFWFIKNARANIDGKTVTNGN